MVVALAGFGPSAVAAPRTKRPYLQAPGPDSITVMWETLSDEPGLLRFGDGSRLDRAVGPIQPVRVAGAKVTFFIY